MTVILNEVALAALLDSPMGAVGLDTQRRAENVLDAYRERVAEITINMPFSVAQSVEKSTREDGSVLIGIFPNGDVEFYLDEKIAFERDRILPQLSLAFHA